MTIHEWVTESNARVYFDEDDNRTFVDFSPYEDVDEIFGGDRRILQAARVSYKGLNTGMTESTKDEKLIKYLWDNEHCYHPDMEVLTIEGWKQWCKCGPVETFMVPNPVDRSLCPEVCEVKQFAYNGNMITYYNDRMSYSVTPNHRMWFKKRITCKQHDFKIYRADEMPQWGHFDPLREYKFKEFDGALSAKFQFIGFYLGDGCSVSPGTVTFHFTKERKMKYLRDILAKLGIEYREKQSQTHDDGVVFIVKTPTFLKAMINYGARSYHKEFFIEQVKHLEDDELRGLLDGLINSDGSISKDRRQIDFCSTSIKLIELYELLGCLFGFDTHRVKNIPQQIHSVLYRDARRTSLEARKEYHGTAEYDGIVFCATTSTGLLMVRGREDSFAFVCGNSSVFEHVHLTFTVVTDLRTAMQMDTHRTWHRNRYSRRYAADWVEFVKPVWRIQNTEKGTNKQAGDKPVSDFDQLGWHIHFQEHCKDCLKHYEYALNAGIAREQAAWFLPTGVLTSTFYTVDLRNLIGFIKVRAEEHAQKEIQDIAEILRDKVIPLVAPWTYELIKEMKDDGE